MNKEDLLEKEQRQVEALELSYELEQREKDAGYAKEESLIDFCKRAALEVETWPAWRKAMPPYRPYEKDDY